MVRRRVLRSRSVAAVALAVVVSGVVTSGCGGDDESDATATTTSSPQRTTAAPTTTEAPTTTAVASTTTTVPGGADAPTGGATTTVPGTTVGGSDPVPDGSNFGYVRGVDVGASTITIDIAELLTGDAAVSAALEDGALEPGATSIDNDYYIRNRNPKLRTAKVAPGSPILVLADPGSPELSAGSLPALAASLTTTGADAGVPVQVVVAGGVVTRIDEVFFP